MRALLIQPPIRDFYRTRFREYPLGLLYLAAVLERAGVETHMLDARLGRPRAVPVPDAFSYIARRYAGGDLYAAFRHFGMPFDRIAEHAARLQPDAVCINVMFTPYAGEAIATAQAVRRALPGIFMVAGGCMATADPDFLMDAGVFDCVVRGEGEEILPRVLNDCSRYRGTVIPDGGHPAFAIGDLDGLAMPARHLVDPDRYRIGRKRYAMIITSRGCPHRCTFCSTHTVAGHIHRMRTVGSVLDEIAECVERWGVRVVDLQDDNLLHRPDRIKEILDAAASRFEGIEFMASNGINARDVDGETLMLMRRAGFRKIDLALGTGDVAGRDALNRPERMDQYGRVLAWASEAGLPVTTYVIVGLPTQPIAEMRQTVEWLMRRDTLIAPSVFYNVPGMPCFDRMKRYEYSKDHAARRSSAFNCFGDDFTRDDIIGLVEEIRAYNMSRR